MIHRIYSDLPKFKNLNLHPGLNVFLADRTDTASNLQTRNRAGKSSLIQVIHFIMGATAGPDSIFRREELKGWTFGLDFDLNGKTVSAERSGAKHGRIVIRHADTSDWPVQPSLYRGIFDSLSIDDWQLILGEKMFGLSAASENERGKFSPTFRSLFSYFVRRESDGGFRRPEAQSTLQQLGDQQTAISYLLGLDWKIPQALENVRRREKTLAELKRAAEGGAFGEVITTSAQLRTQLVIAEEASQRLQEVLNHFEVLPEYRELEQEASQITRNINNLSNQNTLDEQLISEIEASFLSEKPPESDSLLRLYREAGVVLPETVARRFDEVKIFHDSVLANRKDYLTGELNSAMDRLQKRRSELHELDERRAQIMTTLQSRGALDQFQALQKEASRQDVETEVIRQRFQAAEQLEGTRTELEIERARIMQRLRRDLYEQNNRVTQAISTFESISKSLYEEAGSLTLDATDNGLKIDVRIQGQRSRGIQNIQVFCFDLMLMKLAAGVDMGPGFLVHDSHIFDGVDERQVARALQLGAETAQACGWQYLVTLNSDSIPSEFPEGFNFKQYVLPIHLTDEREDGGLFGFRF